jgi:transposase
MEVSTLLADPAAIHLTHIVSADKSLTLVVSARRPSADCPHCGCSSARVHSRYTRRVADLPWHGVAVRLDLHTRRFCCVNELCQRRIFCERLPSVVAAYARKTARLTSALELIGFALGGEAGARLAHQLGLSVSPDTLLARIRRAAVPEASTPRVLGVDDWAKRKGATYGTILIDHERRRPIDLLPEREAGTLATWLRAHPGVEIITRDRGGAYADGARTGAPEAVQIADRWHLLKNLSEVIERFINCHHGVLRQAAECIANNQVSTAPMVLHQGATTMLSSREDRDSRKRSDKRRAGYEQVVRLHKQGMSQRSIARLTGLHRITVRKFLAAGAFPQRAPATPRRSILNPFIPYLHRRLSEGFDNAIALWREVVAQGYSGKQCMVRRYVYRLRARLAALSSSARTQLLAAKTTFKTPATRRAAWWLVQPSDVLEPEQAMFVKQLCRLCPQAATAQKLGREFRQMVRERKVEALNPWLERCATSEIPEMKNFADGVRRDYPAVAAALQHEWSNGRTEGQVNKLKLLKRQMYGRANFDLLRARLLYAA